VRMEAATLNASDFLLIRGIYGVRPELPTTVGAEGVGRVIEVGSAGDASLTGRRVIILPTGEQGCWAEEVVVPQRNVLPVNDDDDVAQLAMLPVNPPTAAVMLRRYGSLKPGDWVAQTAANSAVGQYVIALARQQGLKTLNLVRRQAAAEVVERAGGDRTVVIGEDLRDQVAAALGGEQLSLVLDATGGPDVHPLARRLKFGGTVVNYAFVTKKPPQVSPTDLVFREIWVTGFWLLNWIRTAARDEIEETYRSLADMVAAGTLTAPVEATYPLREYAKAFEHAMADKRNGKILFTFD
jgi:NADPH:quinone reductase-like Zn-dependent oxidoreductase